MDKVKFKFFIDITPADRHGKHIGEVKFSMLTIEVVMCYGMIEGWKKPFFEMNSDCTFLVDIYSYEIIEDETTEDWKDNFRLHITEFDYDMKMLSVTPTDEEPKFFMDIPVVLQEK